MSMDSTGDFPSQARAGAKGDLRVETAQTDRECRRNGGRSWYWMARFLTRRNWRLSDDDVARIARAVVAEMARQPRCAATTKAGHRCPKSADPGSRFCDIHGRMKEDGRLPGPNADDGDDLLETAQ